jgi:hypothetical protein
MSLNCWVVFPSAITAKANTAVDAWATRGYCTLVYQDIGAEPCKADVVRFGNFPGYYRIINALVTDALYEGADVVTCAGDDMERGYFRHVEIPKGRIVAGCRPLLVSVVPPHLAGSGVREAMKGMGLCGANTTASTVMRI